MNVVLQTAARAIAEADLLVITAGAGMGVDSGLPDFRGPQGFWKAYPAYRQLGLDFMSMANPRWFDEDPALAWGFYGHRTHLYRDTVPHEGFAILKRWADERTGIVFTSNVDGQFQRAGFDESVMYEVHGSIHHLQCTSPCTREVWPSDVEVEVDTDTFRAVGDLPRCKNCGAMARPNILMFGDWGYLGTRGDAQASVHARVVADNRAAKTVVIEMGAGTAVPTVRWHGEKLQKRGATLIRINPREAHGPRGTVGITLGALEALSKIDALLYGAPEHR